MEDFKKVTVDINMGSHLKNVIGNYKDLPKDMLFNNPKNKKGVKAFGPGGKYGPGNGPHGNYGQGNGQGEG